MTMKERLGASLLLSWRPFRLEPAIHCRLAVHFMNVGRFHVYEKNEEFSHRKLGNLKFGPYGQCNNRFCDNLGVIVSTNADRSSECFIR